MKVLTQKSIKNTFFAVLLTKSLCIDNRFSKAIVVFRGKNAAYKFIIAILNEYESCKKIMKKHFNKFDHEWRRWRTISIK